MEYYSSRERAEEVRVQKKQLAVTIAFIILDQDNRSYLDHDTLQR
jgi:hypothetical protein